MFLLFRKAFWLFGLTVFLLILFLPGYTKLQELRNKNQELEINIKKLNIENFLLQGEILRLENDPLYQEKIARERMGVVRKGEIPFKIVPEEKK
ncbi:septum formation initiator family protein [bacterium]|nr:MAG: septum formation initiator family protein [bacterium]